MIKIFDHIAGTFQKLLGSEKKLESIDFKSNGELTLGVELEFQLIDPQTQNLASRADELLKLASGNKKIKPEFYLSTVEINTGICKDVHIVEQDIAPTLKNLQDLARKMGVELATTGTHPFARYKDSTISPNERYQQLIARNQWIVRRRTVYGLHMHIGMASGDDCIRYNNFYMHFLPHLLALSCSSPFWQGIDTGLSSCRPTTYETMPTAGQPYRVRDWREFEDLCKTLVKCGSIKSLKDLWWDMRPSPNFGTLEIRVCDVPATLLETYAIVAFTHALGHWFKDNGSWQEAVSSPPIWILRENKWRVMHSGLNAEIVVTAQGKTRPIRDDIREWVDKLAPYTEKLGYQKYMQDILEICKHGTSADRQRKIFKATQSLEDVVKFNVEEFVNQEPHWNI